MAPPALSNATLFNAHPDRQSGWGGWERNDITNFHETPEKPYEESPYYESAMTWGEESPTITGADSGLTIIDQIRTEIDNNEDAHDRVILLSKKYATESQFLNKEDGARLEILNQCIDLKYPRYTDRDLAALEEAEELLAELDKVRGKNSEFF
jgi:hypothetical protein